MRTVALVVVVVLLAVAGALALVPFTASVPVRESGWFSYAPDEPPPVPPEPPQAVVEGDCRPPLVEAWPSGVDRVQAVPRGGELAYEAIDGRLHRSCDAPASRRLALSAALLVPAGVLIAVGLRRSLATQPPER